MLNINISPIVQYMLIGYVLMRLNRPSRDFLKNEQDTAKQNIFHNNEEQFFGFGK